MTAAALAIITRTQNRPHFLARALESVAAQTRRDFVWIIVNDGGLVAAADAAAAQARSRGVSVSVVHRAASCGMEAASNAGVRACESAYVALHDDDDTWHPHFVARMLGYLEDRPTLLGAVCWTMEQFERVDGARVIKQLERPYLHCPETVSLALLALRNQFPPIAFVYRRAAFDQVGGYDESLPVLGDWDFNLRLASLGDIGTLREYLARYHVRAGAGGADANSIVERRALHEEMATQIRNRKLREDLAAGKFGLGALMACAYQAERSAQEAIERGSFLLRLSRKWRELRNRRSEGIAPPWHES
jgi:glycosyltransferase involved in cell wall biosynthesis